MCREEWDYLVRRSIPGPSLFTKRLISLLLPGRTARLNGRRRLTARNLPKFRFRTGLPSVVFGVRRSRTSVYCPRSPENFRNSPVTPVPVHSRPLPLSLFSPYIRPTYHPAEPSRVWRNVFGKFRFVFRVGKGKNSIDRRDLTSSFMPADGNGA